VTSTMDRTAFSGIDLQVINLWERLQAAPTETKLSILNQFGSALPAMLCEVVDGV
jgi:hypothetical protein